MSDFGERLRRMRRAAGRTQAELGTLDPDYDYTQPAEPDWGRVYEE